MQKGAHAMREEFLNAYDSYADALFRHCVFRVHDRERAKDLVQDTFTKTWDHIASGGTIENMRAFLYRTMKNLIIDSYRKKTTDSLEMLLDDGFEPEAGEATPITGAEAREAIATFAQLPEEDREVLLLRFVEGWEPREIAEELGLSSNVVSVRINRAIKKVRDILHATDTI